MSSIEHIKASMGGGNWPRPELTMAAQANDMAGYDVAATMWVTQEAFDKSSETKLYLDMKEWVGKAWPFEKAAWPGKDIPLAEWQALPKK